MAINTGKTTFALFFGTRQGCPASLMASARDKMPSFLKGFGHEVLMLDADCAPQEP